MKTNARPLKAVKGFLDRLDALLVKSALSLLGPDGAPARATTLATGVDVLDEALDGGLPRGRVAEIYGAAGGGKTALALALIATAQRAGETCAFVDVERGLDGRTAAVAGVDLERLVAVRPRTGEEALQIVEGLLRRRAAGLVVVDSVAALLPREELALPLGEAPRGAQARLMSQGLRRLVGAVADAGAVVVFVNQLRTTFEEDGRAIATTAGGQALHFYAATRLSVRRVGRTLVVDVEKGRAGVGTRIALPPLGAADAPEAVLGQR
jgi:recombination protein RecA